MALIHGKQVIRCLLYYAKYRCSYLYIHVGLSFLGAGIGNVLGSIVSGRLSDYLLARSSQMRGGVSKAEDRLTLNAWYVVMNFYIFIHFLKMFSQAWRVSVDSTWCITLWLEYHGWFFSMASYYWL